MAHIRTHAQLIGASLIALIVGGAVGAAVAGSSSQVHIVTADRLRVITTVHTVARTRTRVKIVAAPAPPVTRAPSGSSRTPSPAVAATPPVGAPAGSSPVVPGPPRGPPQHFAGTGPTTLGDITVTGTATLSWTTNRGPMRILFDGSAVGVDSTASAGRMVVPPQTYRQVKVDTHGHWTIKIS